MAYYLNLFSPETYETFSNSDRTVSGFRVRQRALAERISVGDKFICYMTKLSRWVGVLEINSDWYEDNTPLYAEDDPFVIRFKVRPIVWLEKQNTIPIREDFIWENLSFTKGLDKSGSQWTGRLRSSLALISDDDGCFLEEIISAQAGHHPQVFAINSAEYEKLITHHVRRSDKIVSVSVPQDYETEVHPLEQTEVRESIRMQALLAEIGALMGMSIWLPRNDRGRVLAEVSNQELPVLDTLPLNYDDTTLKTIEQIDVLWLKGRAIKRAFEVEHTTSIYSGILRMADLLALQPNMDIQLHIVAPLSRREKVMQELQRPVFSLLEKGPLYESCTYLSYDDVMEISQLKHLHRMHDSVLDDYADIAQ